MSSDIVIKIKNLAKKYTLQHSKKNANGIESRDHWALTNISFDIKKRECVGIIGPNGSGKSTLLKILSGVTKPTTGSVEIFGKVASILDIGAGFHQELSGKENIFLNGQILGCSKREIEKEYSSIVTFSGIEEFINEPVKNYSNGMYLRLAFSILAHLDFDVYLFDEVMSVGDATFLHKSRQKILELKSSGKTILIISHNINELSFCDRIIELNSGEIKSDGGEQDVLIKYVLASIAKTNHPVHQHSIRLTEFEENLKSHIVSLLSVSLSQATSEEQTLSNNFATTIEIEYCKHLDEDTLEPVIMVSDASGVVIFVSSPIISASVFAKQEAGRYMVSCEIPPGLLSSNVYVLSISFVKNSHVFKTFPSDIALNTHEIKDALFSYGIVASYANLLFFRVTVVLENFTDFGQLNLPVGLLLPLLKWKTTKLE